MWNIVGDAKEEWQGKKHTGCLLWVAGGTKEEAEATLARIKSNPDKYGREDLEKYENIRVEEDKDPWYLDSRNFRD